MVASLTVAFIIILFFIIDPLGFFDTEKETETENILDMDTHMLLYESMYCVSEETDIAYRLSIRDIYQNIHTQELVSVRRYPILSPQSERVWHAKQTLLDGIHPFPSINTFQSWKVYRIPTDMKLMRKNQ